MSGKNNKKGNNTAKMTTASERIQSGRWILLCLLFVLLIALVVFVFYMESRDDISPETHPEASEQPGNTELDESTVLNETQSEQPVIDPTAATILATDPESVFGHDLGSGIVITDTVSYTGAFMEDRTDEVVSGVLGIRITNTGEEFIQTMSITLIAENGVAEFSLSTLFPGDTVIVLEKNRMKYVDTPKFIDAQVHSVALFDAHPGMAEDKLDIQCLNGVINITNFSGEDISGDILVYYKNYVSGVFYGGITYRLRLEGGLKAGEIRQCAAAHFNTSNSTVVFVTCS